MTNSNLFNMPDGLQDKIFEWIEEKVGDQVTVEVRAVIHRDRTYRKWFKDKTIHESKSKTFTRNLEVSHDKRGMFIEPWSIDCEYETEITDYRVLLRDKSVLCEDHTWYKHVPAGGSVLLQFGISRG